MKRIAIAFLILLPHVKLEAQGRSSHKKYPSLLWEISGKELRAPSYLFGTMHVSSKIAFHLSDSFYQAIKNADVVALETNPESWQEDLTKYEFVNYANYGYGPGLGGFQSIPNDYLTNRTLQFLPYDKQMEKALYSNPSTINNLLYRSYSEFSSDFEEDTFLDMYIYQVGKKWKKNVTGVERYDESMRLMMEAYRDAASDRNKKERSFDTDEGFSPERLQEAYRTGNLDLLDSINRLNSFSEAFDEKFLYKRNEIQANSIDSILRSGQTLFVGVGAAHLPGIRGVIDLLRKQGYTLRPVMMGERDSRHKDQVEKLRVPVVFIPHHSNDGFYRLEIPGKFYRFNESGIVGQEQYADMANGSYYMVTRVKINSSLWGHSNNEVSRKIDSVLYENIPGKILTKQNIVRNGYKGFDITNRTRRGDYQRYNIFITPFEILFFKMSGTGDYVKEGPESKKFFNSIRLKEYKQESWKKYQPPSGGFSVDLPHEPFVSHDDQLWGQGGWQYEATDKLHSIYFTVLRNDIHNYHFAEEDTFDLALMQESFASSGFIERLVERKLVSIQGFSALDCSYENKDGSVLRTRFLIQGPHYYTLIAHANTFHSTMESFLNSFRIIPLKYREAVEQEDSLLHFKVRSPVSADSKKEQIVLAGNNGSYGDDPETRSEFKLLEDGSIFRSTVISNDTTGEKIYVSFTKLSRYHFSPDSISFELEGLRNVFGKDTNWIIRNKKSNVIPGNLLVREYILTGPNSSRLIYLKSFYRAGSGFTLMTEGDSLTEPSSFIRTFFDTFSPGETGDEINPYLKKSAVYFFDFFSTDSSAHKRAIRNAGEIELNEEDLPLLKKAIKTLGWDEEKYFQTKKSFISKLVTMRNEEASDYLMDLYYAAGDTVELQYTILQALLKQKSKYSLRLFRDLMTTEPPILDLETGWTIYPPLSALSDNFSGNSRNFHFIDELDDSLELTRVILPDLLPLLNLDDYKWYLMRLLADMVGKGLVGTEDYESYLSKFLIEAKQELKRKSISEKKKAIEKARNKVDRSYYTFPDDEDRAKEDEVLFFYAVILLPFWEKNASIPPFFEQLLKSEGQLKYRTMVLMLRNKKSIPDSMLNYFATTDEYRYRLYKDLEELNMLKLFPHSFNNHVSLAGSLLVSSKFYRIPDSLVFVDKIETEFRRQKGDVYFFKYKHKKDDATWKLATVGLVPQVLKEKVDLRDNRSNIEKHLKRAETIHRSNDFIEMTDIKLNNDESVRLQLQTLMKKLSYSKRKSAKFFYEDTSGGRRLND